MFYCRFMQFETFCLCLSLSNMLYIHIYHRMVWSSWGDTQRCHVRQRTIGTCEWDCGSRGVSLLGENYGREKLPNGHKWSIIIWAWLWRSFWDQVFLFAPVFTMEYNLFPMFSYFAAYGRETSFFVALWYSIVSPGPKGYFETKNSLIRQYLV